MIYKTVGDVVEAINSGSATRTDISKEVGCSPKTVQERLKKAGMQWNPHTQKYEVRDGIDEEKVYRTPFKGRTSPSERSSEDAVVNNKETLKKHSQAKIQPKNEVEQLDMIDILLRDKKQSKKREYRGFYFDNDVLEVIDSLASGKKSELINQALRKVFTDKGYL